MLDRATSGINQCGKAKTIAVDKMLSKPEFSEEEAKGVEEKQICDKGVSCISNDSDLLKYPKPIYSLSKLKLLEEHQQLLRY